MKLGPLISVDISNNIAYSHLLRSWSIHFSLRWGCWNAHLGPCVFCQMGARFEFRLLVVQSVETLAYCMCRNWNLLGQVWVVNPCIRLVLQRDVQVIRVFLRMWNHMKQIMLDLLLLLLSITHLPFLHSWTLFRPSHIFSFLFRPLLLLRCDQVFLRRPRSTERREYTGFWWEPLCDLFHWAVALVVGHPPVQSLHVFYRLPLLSLHPGRLNLENHLS